MKRAGSELQTYKSDRRRADIKEKKEGRGSQAQTIIVISPEC
jgi:hypothetical protein